MAERHRRENVRSGDRLSSLEAIDSEGDRSLSPMDGASNSGGFRTNPDAR